MKSLPQVVERPAPADPRFPHDPHGDPAPPTEEDCARPLLVRIARGDVAAFESLYGLTAARLLGIARAILKNRADVEEVVADVYWYVWRNASQFDAERGTVAAWLMILCRSRAIDRLRSSHCKGPRTSLNRDVLAEELVDSECPTDLLHAIERGSALHRTLAQLSPIHRQLLSLAFFEGLTHPEIAAKTNLALGTVKSHLRRALQAIRRVIPPGP